MRVARLLALAVGLLALPDVAAAQQLDWEVEERAAGPALGWLRGVRDGALGLLDDASDLQVGLFAEATLTLGSLVMAASDGVGLVDDNPVSQHLFKGVASKSLARTAYLLHLTGAEAVLGSHGLEREWYVEAALVELNPLLDPAQDGPALPLEPLAFVGQGTVHTEVYTARIPGGTAAASLLADGLLRPVGNLVRISGFHGTAERLERLGTRLVRRTVD